jgi:hypothetical protein
MWSSWIFICRIASTPAWVQRWTSAVGTNGVNSGDASGLSVAAVAGLAAAVFFEAVATFVGARWSRRPVAVFPIERWRLSSRAGV